LIIFDSLRKMPLGLLAAITRDAHAALPVIYFFRGGIEKPRACQADSDEGDFTGGLSRRHHRVAGRPILLDKDRSLCNPARTLPAGKA
jgi:hypothetical protein